MNRGTFILSLVVSLVIHASLLALPRHSAPAPTPTDAATVQPVEVVETELARLAPDFEPAATPEPEPEPEREPDPAPEPARQPEPESPAPERADPAPVAPEPARTIEPEAPSAPPVAPSPGPIRPPRPSLVDMLEEARTALPAGGDLGGGPEPAGPSRPELRIDWGDANEAHAILEAGGMRVVIVRGPASEVVIDDEMIPAEGRWARRAYQPPITARYSNRMRIVDDVPAFDALRDGAELRGDEHLAVLVPEPIERLLVSAEIRAAYRLGLSLEDVRSLAGRFTLNGGTVAFETIDLQPRALREDGRRDES